MAAHAFVAIDHLEEKKAKTNANVELLRARRNTNITDTPTRQLVTFEVDAIDADVTAYEPIFINGDVLGFCTSGGYSHHTGKSIAFGLIPVEHANDGLAVEIEILGKLRPATLITAPIFDPDGTRLRG